MPSYKTHSIHGGIIIPDIKKHVDIDKNDIKTFCIGPDALMVSDNKIFEYQHANKVREYFIKMIRYIKRNKLLDNEQVMAFLYGQIDHLVLDSVMHPFIYYMTEGIKSDTVFQTHGLVEMWIDDYVEGRYETEQITYHQITDKKLLRLIDKLYSEIFKTKNESIKYNIGYFLIYLFDVLGRHNMLGIIEPITKIGKIGDIIYRRDIKRALPFLNTGREIWTNPETDESYCMSFDDLWRKSIEVSLETINDVNNYLYSGKTLNNQIIMSDTSYNTGLSCSKGQILKHIKRWQ